METNTIAGSLSEATTALSSLANFIHSFYGMPGYMLVLLTCIVFGYVLKIMQWFPNQRIPSYVIFWGTVWNLILADDRAAGASLRLWVGRNLLIGMVIGFVAWAIHNKLLKSREGRIPFLNRLLPDSGNSDPQAFVRPPPKPPTQNP